MSSTGKIWPSHLGPFRSSRPSFCPLEDLPPYLHSRQPHSPAKPGRVRASGGPRGSKHPSTTTTSSCENTRVVKHKSCKNILLCTATNYAHFHAQFNYFKIIINVLLSCNILCVYYFRITFYTFSPSSYFIIILRRLLNFMRTLKTYFVYKAVLPLLEK